MRPDAYAYLPTYLAIGTDSDSSSKHFALLSYSACAETAHCVDTLSTGDDRGKRKRRR